MDGDGEKQIAQMVAFILHEAQQKKADIDRKAKEEFNISKMQIVKEMREKVRKEYATKLKKVETKQAIDRSTAINQMRIEKVSARTKALDGVLGQCKERFARVITNKQEYQALLQKLVVQGCLKLLESDVKVQCRAEDKALVEAVLGAASQQYSQVIKQQTKVNRTVKLVVDKTPLPSSGTNAVMGGVVLNCFNGLIKVDNTLDTRLRLCDDQDKPAIRSILFPQ
jgi:V-type H+-transporting ATPase subunit E